MATFRDRGGGEWRVSVTVGDLGDLRAAGLDLAAATADPEGFLGIFDADPEVLVRVLWVLCREEAAERNLSPEAFGRLFDGDAVESAAVAVAEAACDFFRNRPTCRALRGRVRAVIGEILARAEPGSANSNGSAGGSAGNSGSTPARSASASCGG